VPLVGRTIEVMVTEPAFYDRAGTRMTQSITTARPTRFARALTRTPVDIQPSASRAEAILTLAPPVCKSPARKFNVRTADELAPSLRAATREGNIALWLGPDEFLLVDGETVGDEVLDEAMPRIVTDAIVDVSHQTIGIRLEGPRAAWCLNAFCALDLDDFPPGACTRTLLGKAEIILWRRTETSFHIETARSFVPYVWACLEEARRELLPSAVAC
jgi:heterotetrameric sarcosine oxidase gamma subunit